MQTLLRSTFRGFVIVCISISAALLAERTLYVQSSSARLLTQPNMNSPGPPLQKGESVSQIGEQGMFYNVRATNGAGYVPRVYAATMAPGDKVNFGSINKDTSVQARARASNYAQTASARGITQSQNLRTRGGASDFDFDSVEWLEKLEMSEVGLKEFQGQTQSTPGQTK